LPRLYLSPGQFDMFPAALTFAFQVTQLKAIPGAIDQLLARASRRVDGFARKRIVTPPATTIGTGGIAPGATSLPLTSTLGFDDGQEEAIIIGSGGAQETIPVAPGGVTVTSWSGVYPGSLKLAQPVIYNHSAGEAIQGCYQEVSKDGNESGRDVSADQAEFDQAAQIAIAHAPASVGPTTRTIFLKSYPIVTLYKLEYALPTGADYISLGISGVQTHPSAGYIVLPLGSFVVAGGFFKATYLAGFANPPDGIMEATAWYAADELQTMTSKGAYEVQSGKTKVKYLSDSAKTTKSIYELRAEEIISRGYRRTA
jgi:hypothetical protein